jgi:hypothetical protein
VCRPSGRRNIPNYSREVTAFSRDAGAIPAASTFSKHASTSDNTCHNTSKLSDDGVVESHDGRRDLGQVTTADGGSRPGRATESATRLMAEYPDLAVVLAAWPELSEAVRAGIVLIASAAQQ